jgi:predicted ATPase/class 3 adenylate cyclase
VRADLPSGRVTFLFTDIEGSTKLLHELGPKRYAQALAEHRRVLREASSSHGGVEVDTQGDAFFVAFPDPKEALAAASRTQEALASGPIRVRMGLHTGSPHLTPEGYVGEDVHKGARIAAAGYGGQVILSKETRELVGEGFSLTDFGEHRVKDFATPVWIYQLGTERFPPLKTISNTNLPRPASSFVGREREVAEVVFLLQDGARLLTLTGPGGSGKTRLAIEAAAEVVPSFRNGVFWVELATIKDPSLVTETIAQTLGTKGSLAAHISEREMLLVPDNFEQVADAAPDLASLVEACPHLRVLLTSREVLRMRGEVEYAVPPLADPEAVELFCTRSHLAPDEAIAELCRRLDNLPLAVELAAARTSVLSPSQILQRISQRLDLLKGGRDAEARQRTLRTTIEWSHDLLDQGEKRLFARLAVFRGGCSLEAAEEVADANIDVIQSLVDKNLLRHTGERFWMLETIREYARERLAESGEADGLQGRHGEHFLALAEEAASEVIGAHPRAWLERLEADHDNLRAALDRFHETGDLRRALELAGALWGFWQIRGHFAEGRRRLEAALTADAIPPATRARALLGWVSLATETAPVEQTRARAEEALRIYDSLGDKWGAASSRWRLGGIAAFEREWETARDIFEQSRQEFRAAGDEHHFLALTRGVAWMNEELGDIARYRELVEEYLAGARAIGDERLEARGVGARAWWAMEEGRLDDALLDMKRSYEIDCGLGFSVFLAVDLVRFAAILVRQGRTFEAAQLVARSDLLTVESGAGRESWMQKERDDTLALIRTQLSNAELEEALGHGRKLTVGEAAALAIGETHASSR